MSAKKKKKFDWHKRVNDMIREGVTNADDLARIAFEKGYEFGKADSLRSASKSKRGER